MGWRKVGGYLLLALLILSVDFASKIYVHTHLPLMQAGEYPYDGIPVFQGIGGVDFAIVHVLNRGVAWGWLAGWQDYLPYLRLGIIAALAAYFVSSRVGREQRGYLILIIAGALGNVIDYFLYHHVVDMFYFVCWGFSYPVFNVADSAIFCGIVGLILRPKKLVIVND